MCTVPAFHGRFWKKGVTAVTAVTSAATYWVIKGFPITAEAVTRRYKASAFPGKGTTVTRRPAAAAQTGKKARRFRRCTAIDTVVKRTNNSIVALTRRRSSAPSRRPKQSSRRFNPDRARLRHKRRRHRQLMMVWARNERLAMVVLREQRTIGART